MCDDDSAHPKASSCSQHPGSSWLSWPSRPTSLLASRGSIDRIHSKTALRQPKHVGSLCQLGEIASKIPGFFVDPEIHLGLHCLLRLSFRGTVHSPSKRNLDRGRLQTSWPCLRIPRHILMYCVAVWKITAVIQKSAELKYESLPHGHCRTLSCGEIFA